jgi:hypothetical protein
LLAAAGAIAAAFAAGFLAAAGAAAAALAAGLLAVAGVEAAALAGDGLLAAVAGAAAARGARAGFESESVPKTLLPTCMAPPRLFAIA